MSYELHPLCTLFPRLSGAEFDALRDDIKANGLRQPVILHDGMILDGGNRYRACQEAGVEPTFEEYDGGNLVSFVLSANLHRRHMTPGQQAAIVASAQDWGQANARGGDRRSDQSATLHLDSVADRVAQSGASVRTQKMADKVAKADPDLAKKVAHGEVSLPKAVKQVEQKPSKTQGSRTPTPPPATKSSPTQTPVAANNADDLDDSPSLEELVDEFQKENLQLNEVLKTLQADDTLAELAKLKHIQFGLEERLGQSMDKIKFLEKELNGLGRHLATLREITGAASNSAAIAAVKALVKNGGAHG